MEKRIHKEFIYVSVIAVIALVFTLTLVILSTFGIGGSDAGEYELLSPTVYQGQALNAYAFIKTEDGSHVRAELESAADTTVPGIYTVSVRVGDRADEIKCSYTVLPSVRDSVTVEAGASSVPAEALAEPDVPADVIDELDIRIVDGTLPQVPGEYEATVAAGTASVKISVTVVDTTPPSAKPKTLTIDAGSGTPKPEDFVDNIVDATDVTCAFDGDYNFGAVGKFEVKIVLTDTSGNTATVTSTAECRTEYDFLLSPDVYLGDELSLDDFVDNQKAEGFSVRLEGEPVTDTEGNHTVTVQIEDAGGISRTLDLVYIVKNPLRDTVVLEAGFDEITPRDITRDGTPERVLGRISIADQPKNDTLGDHELEVIIGNVTRTVRVTVVDTTPPTATPKNLTYQMTDTPPVPLDLVENIKDATNVTARFAEDYKFTEEKTYEVNIILTDAAGNSATVTVTLKCTADSEPPVITFSGDIYVEQGGTVSYREGVTVTDNSGENISYTVNADDVDLKTVGDYTVIYTAADSHGNSAQYERALHVTSPDEVSYDEMMGVARWTYNKYIATEPDMTKWQIAYAIFNWSYDNIAYIDSGIDKSSWITAAYNGFNTGKGDCFTYMSTSRALFEIAGIPCMVVEHDPAANDNFRHWWLLVDIGDGWYHYDSTRRIKCPEFKAFMRTDEELAWYCANYDKRYYRFDASAYPERATEKYYTEMTESPAGINR